MWWLAVVGLALAQDPDEAEIEITVWGDLAIRKARDEIVSEAEALGWRADRQHGRTVFKGPKAWMGAAILYDDGTLGFRTPVLGLAPRPIEDYAYDPRREVANVGPNDLDLVVGAGPTFRAGASRRKLEPARTELLRALSDALVAYRDVLQRTALEELLLALPDRLDALWQAGVPLETGPPLTTREARREAVLQHWATRADTPEGHRVAEAIEAWLDAEVQASDAPITEEERARFEAMRPDGRTLPE